MESHWSNSSCHDVKVLSLELYRREHPQCAMTSPAVVEDSRPWSMRWGLPPGGLTRDVWGLGSSPEVVSVPEAFPEEFDG